LNVEVLVRLAARDPWGFTVLDALKRKFAIGPVAAVDRLKCWELDFDYHDRDKALEVTGRILEGTALLANPNRDIWIVRAEPIETLPRDFLERPGSSEHVFAVKVRDREDIMGRSMQSVLHRRLGLAEIAEVRFSLVWILRLSGADRDCYDLARRIAVARAWREGLLANPHCQQAEVLRGDEYLWVEAR
jgi:phosphoribosylformylglycinamidine (FGAM) synthase PurS component